MESREKNLSAWQLTMLALGTVIGGSFFLGSAIAIKSAGPGVLVAYIIGGILVYLILYALSEMSVAEQAPGSFRTYSEKMYGPLLGFLVGWIYWTGLVLAMSSEAIAVSIFLHAWIPRLSLPVTGSLIIIAVTLANLLGVDRLSKLESGLAGVKLLAIVGFIVLGFVLVTGLLPGRSPIGLGVITREAFLPGGFGGLAGSMLIVMFTYAGFEVIGLASSEARNPHQTIPRAITYTVLGLVGLYLLAILFLLPLIPTATLSENRSPMVAALTGNGLGWAGGIINIVLVTAILSTMLAATFGIARMVYSLAAEGHAPSFLKDRGDIPYRGIAFSGLAMLTGLGLGFILPRKIYLFLVSSGGFALLFSYLIIMITHYKFRRLHGCPPDGKCRFPGYPYTSWLSIATLLAIIFSMPLIPGQGSGLLAGLLFVALFIGLYYLKTFLSSGVIRVRFRPERNTLTEFADEISEYKRTEEVNNTTESKLKYKNGPVKEDENKNDNSKKE